MFDYPYMKQYIETLPENMHEGMMLSVTVLNYDRIVDAYGYLYADHIMEQLYEMFARHAEHREFCCRVTRAKLFYYQPSEHYIDGYLLQQDFLRKITEIYVGEKQPNQLKCNISYGQASLESMDEFVDFKQLDYEASNKKKHGRSLYDTLNLAGRTYTEEESLYMNEAQKFSNRLMELIRSSKDARSTIHAVLWQMGLFFHLDRILVIDTDMDIGENRILYQWTSQPEYKLDNYFETMSKEEIENSAARYNAIGYLVFYQDAGSFTKGNVDQSIRFAERVPLPSEEFQKRVIYDVLLGAQLWLPSMLDGHYSGAWQFDRKSGEHYSELEVFWLAEVVNMVMTFINRMQADSANEAKSNFLSAMSHEIRTPMNAIIGLAEISLREEMTQEQRQNLEMIHAAATGLLGIINDILDFSKIESGKMEIVNEPYEILSIMNDVAVIAATRNQTKALELTYDIPENLPKVMVGDMVRIKQVIINLTNNAIKYTERGYVKIKIACDPVVDGKTWLRFSVRDSGIGIHQEDIGKLFQSFSQVDVAKNHKKEGTGLGLAICDKLVSLMGGQIHVESSYGEGSEFSFEVPQVVEDATPSGRLEEYRRNSSEETFDFVAPKAHVLVVDDNEMNVKVFQGLLAPLQIQIDTAENGKVALSMISHHTYHMVFMDHMMPVMDGVEALRRIRDELPGGDSLPVVALSANATTDARKMFLEVGFDGFVSKPFRMKDMIEVLKKHLPAEVIQSGEYTEGLQRWESEELLQSLMGDYYKLIDSRTKKIQGLFQEGRIRDFTIEVHGMKSSSRMIGATDLSEQFYELEQLGNAENVEEIQRKLPTVLAAFQAYKEKLQPYVKEQELVEVPKEEVLVTLRELKEAADSFDMDVVDVRMEELGKVACSKQLREKIKALDVCVADVDLEQIMIITEELIEAFEKDTK